MEENNWKACCLHLLLCNQKSSCFGWQSVGLEMIWWSIFDTAISFVFPGKFLTAECRIIIKHNRSVGCSLLSMQFSRLCMQMKQCNPYLSHIKIPRGLVWRFWLFPFSWKGRDLNRSAENSTKRCKITRKLCIIIFTK